MGLRRVGPRKALSKVFGLAQCRKRVRAVALGIIAEQAFGLDPKAPEPLQCTSHEQRRVTRVLRGVDLGVRQACRVIDADERDFVACTSPPSASLAMDSVTHSLDPSPLLRVDMKWIARRVRIIEADSAPPRVVRSDRRPRALDASRRSRPEHPDHERSPKRPFFASGAEPCHASNPLSSRPPGKALRPAASVLKTRRSAFLEAIQPLMSGLAARAALATGQCCFRTRRTRRRRVFGVSLALGWSCTRGSFRWSRIGFATPFPPSEPQVSTTSLGSPPSTGLLNRVTFCWTGSTPT